MMAAVAFVDVAIGLLCCTVAVTDFRRGIIPDWCNGALLAAGGLLSSLGGLELLAANLFDAVIVFGLFLLLRAGYRRLRGYGGLGLGDVKFLGAATVSIGLVGIQLVVLLASVTGLVEALVRRLAFDEQLTSKTRLRFGPHLALALVAVLALRQAGYW
jgi:leader peptidase (prepilin peptidase) / N-methyltransferase